jgi:hypothetical protein
MSHDIPPQTPASPAIAWGDAVRADQFNRWLTGIAAQHGLHPDSLRLASADASFRRYFRIDARDGSRIIMDAPPDKENSAPFVKVAALMHAAGVHGPQVLAWDEPLGFMLLTDLGAQTMMQVINREQPQANLPLYLQAVDALVGWQLSYKTGVLPPYDEALLRRELELFPDWYIGRHKGVTVDAAMRQTLDKSFEEIIRHNLSAPSVFVHRDFMPRNLMVSDPGTLGVLDFQDAVYGPITYDIASLMRDAFLSWDEDFCLDVTIRYWEKARKAGLPVGDDFGEFYRGVEWMGLQRHLKVAGIFARLTLRDGKPQYLADTPRFITYIRTTCERYRELKPLLRLVEKLEGIEMPNVFGFGRQ